MWDRIEKRIRGYNPEDSFFDVIRLCKLSLNLINAHDKDKTIYLRRESIEGIMSSFEKMKIEKSKDYREELKRTQELAGIEVEK